MKRIGRYRVLGLLGKGGMSKVYIAALPVIDRVVALKRLDPHPHLLDLMGEKALHAIFVTEARTLAGLRHPNIVDILDFDRMENTPFYVMEYYANSLGVMMGETYRSERPTRILRIDRAVQYGRQILEGLRRLHHAGIIHRDIKPFNILLTEDDEVKISDFGLSKVRGETFTGPPNLKVGSPYYAAPEQVSHPDAVDFSADLYSLGVILYRMLTGGLPNDPEDASSRWIPPSDVNPDLDAGWDAFLLRALAETPKHRYPDAASMREALDRLASEWEIRRDRTCLLSPPSPPKTAPPPKHPLRRDPRKVSVQEAPRRFGLDSLWRPKSYIENDFVVEGGGLVRDRATDLIWENAGSEYPVVWKQAEAHVSSLNRVRFGGYDRWRVPTIDELMSLLTPMPHGTDFCMAPVFDPRCRWLWSIDRCTFTASWYVSVDLGFVFRQEIHARFHVKAVCSVPPDARR